MRLVRFFRGHVMVFLCILSHITARFYLDITMSDGERRFLLFRCHYTALLCMGEDKPTHRQLFLGGYATLRIQLRVMGPVASGYVRPWII